MTYYQWPPATIAKSTISTIYENLPAGIIEYLDMFFPDGCDNEVKINVYFNEVQLFPRDPSMSITGNNETIKVAGNERIETGKLKITINNTDIAYSHWPIIRMQLNSSNGSWLSGSTVNQPITQKATIWDKLRNLLGGGLRG